MLGAGRPPPWGRVVEACTTDRFSIMFSVLRDSIIKTEGLRADRRSLTPPDVLGAVFDLLDPGVIAPCTQDVRRTLAKVRRCGNGGSVFALHSLLVKNMRAHFF